MRRPMMIVVLVAISAAAAAAALTTILNDGDDLAANRAPLATSTPSPTPTPVVATPTSSPGAADATALASPTDDVSPGATPARTARSVNCDDEPKFCSNTHAMPIEGGRYTSIAADGRPDYSGAPTITMESKALESDESEAEPGDEISSIHVEVVVENKTGRTFTFDSRDIVLEIRRNGRVFDVLETNGEGFDMTPQGKMTGTFDRPITMDGTYSWQARTWYRPR